MIKGYIFYNGDRQWELGFLASLDEEGKALYTTDSVYSTQPEALKALIQKQIEAQ